MTEFKKEKDFEDALVKLLTEPDLGWKDGVLNHPTEKDLLDNWAKILYGNNRDVDRLGDFPLTDGEMQQILEQIKGLRTPLALNGFINGKTVSVKRDNPGDGAHFGKEVSLFIYDRMQIAGGKTRYQIARQPHLPTPHFIFISIVVYICVFSNPISSRFAAVNFIIIPTAFFPSHVHFQIVRIAEQIMIYRAQNGCDYIVFILKAQFSI